MPTSKRNPRPQRNLGAPHRARAYQHTATIMPMLYRLQQRFKRALARVLPCMLCGLDHQHNHGLCQDCWQDLPWSKHTIHRHEQDILVACHYRFPIDRLIQKFKYEQHLHYQALFAACILSLDLPQVDALVPMPISKQRLIERGYNQMKLIADTVSAQLGLPIWQPIIRAAQHAQKGLSRVERLEQIKQQFRASPTLEHHYPRVLILDDVVTTGSSVHALAQALKQLGCTEVYIASIAAGQLKPQRLQSAADTTESPPQSSVVPTKPDQSNHQHRDSTNAFLQFQHRSLVPVLT